MLWLRPIDAGAATVLAGTENAEIPFWSPDSRWLGFAANGKLQKMDVAGGGQPQVICEIEGVAGGTWNSDGVIVFDQVGKPLQRVSAEGGNSTPILTLDASRQEVAQNAPYFLPDGRHLVYLSRGKNGSNVMLASLDGKLNRVLIEAYAIATYAPNPRGGGWILYNNPRSQLLARPSILRNSSSNRPDQPWRLQHGVGTGRWWYASATGLLAFRHSYGTQYQLTWFGRDGHPQGTVGDPGLLAAPRISPDPEDRRVPQRTDEQNTDIWTFDLTRNTSARFTFEPGPEAAPAWSSDSKSILYGSGTPADPSSRARSGSPSTTSIIERSANGVGQGTVVVSPTGTIVIPTAVSRDGRWLVACLQSKGNTSGLSWIRVARGCEQEYPHPGSRDGPRRLDLRAVTAAGCCIPRFQPIGAKFLRYSPFPRKRAAPLRQANEQVSTSGRRPASLACGRQGDFLRRARWNDDGGAGRIG